MVLFEGWARRAVYLFAIAKVVVGSTGWSGKIVWALGFEGWKRNFGISAMHWRRQIPQAR